MVAFGLLISLASAGAVVGQDVTKEVNNIAIVKKAEVSMEQARAKALKKVKKGEVQS